MPFETETRGDSDSDSGEAFPFTAVKAGAKGSPALSLSTYGDCVLRTGRCRTANILVLGVDDGVFTGCPGPLGGCWNASNHTHHVVMFLKVQVVAEIPFTMEGRLFARFHLKKGFRCFPQKCTAASRDVVEGGAV
jgi:hypothetical protein